MITKKINFENNVKTSHLPPVNILVAYSGASNCAEFLLRNFTGLDYTTGEDISKIAVLKRIRNEL